MHIVALDHMLGNECCWVVQAEPEAAAASLETLAESGHSGAQYATAGILLKRYGGWEAQAGVGGRREGENQDEGGKVGISFIPRPFF